jgi:hypothetical protein
MGSFIRPPSAWPAGVLAFLLGWRKGGGPLARGRPSATHTCESPGGARFGHGQPKRPTRARPSPASHSRTGRLQRPSALTPPKPNHNAPTSPCTGPPFGDPYLRIAQQTVYFDNAVVDPPVRVACDPPPSCHPSRTAANQTDNDPLLPCVAARLDDTHTYYS